MKRLEVTSKRSTEEKLMTYLMQTAKEQGKSSFHITYDRQQLADYLEVDRSGLSAVIGKLKKAEKSNAAKICLNFCEDIRNKGFPAKSQHKPPIGVKDLYRGFVQFGLFNLLNAYFTVCKTVKQLILWLLLSRRQQRFQLFKCKRKVFRKELFL